MFQRLDSLCELSALADISHEISRLIFSEKKKKNFRTLSVAKLLNSLRIYNPKSDLPNTNAQPMMCNPTQLVMVPQLKCNYDQETIPYRGPYIW